MSATDGRRRVLANELRERNWGRWGSEDEVGTMNLLTPDRVRAAASLVRSGKVYSLAEPLVAGPMWPGRRRPWHLTATVDHVEPGDWGGADDVIVIHTHSSTHMDGLGHIWYGGRLYNGFPASTVSSDGAERCGIAGVSSIVGRGVLLDVAGLHGVEHLEPGYPITVHDLEAACSTQGVGVGAGDIVLVRTGWMTVRRRDEKRFYASHPGLGPDTVPWLAERDVVAVGSDNGSVDAWPPPEEPGPLHAAFLRDLGAYLIEYLNLEEVAAERVHEFLFVAAPLRIERGVGSPLNPLVIA